MSGASRKPAPEGEAPVSSGKQFIRQDVDRGLSLSERLSLGLHRISWHTPLRRVRLRRAPPLKLIAAPKDPVMGDRAEGQAILAGKLVFRSHVASMAEPDFRYAAPPDLFDHLHSFSWLRDLAAAATRADGAMVAERAVRAWLVQCDNDTSPAAWRPDLCGRRILFWTSYAPYILSSSDSEFRAQVLAALARMARYLDRGANKAIPGLPRITAWAGSIVGALVLQGGRLGRSETGFAKAILEGVHEDGGLVSRSPEEQLELVELLGQLRAAYNSVRADPPETLVSALERAPAALLAATLGDGDLGHWQGSGLASTRRVSAAMEATGAAHRPLRLSGGWGYQRLEAKKAVVVIDAAPPPPARAATNGCASTLAFEFSDGNDRLIVNCGGGRHVSPAIRSVLRVTAAHSGLVLADRNSTAVEEDGTLGRGVSEVEIVRESEGGIQRIDASHDGYVRRFGMVHRRLLELASDGLSLSGEDRLEHKGRSRGWKQTFAVRFHLAPNVEVTRTADGKGAILRIRGGNVWQFRCRGGSLLNEDSIWIDASSRPHQTQQLVISGETEEGGTVVTWSLRRAG